MKTLYLALILIFFLALVFAEDLNTARTLNDQNVSDENVFKEKAEDVPEEEPELELEENFEDALLPEITFVFPLQNQVLKGLEIIVVSIQNFGEIISHVFQLNETEFTGTVSENTLTADLNTLEFDNNQYTLKVDVCDSTGCYFESVEVLIENALEEIIEREEEKTAEKKFSIIPSNTFSALSFFDSEGNLIDSTTEMLEIEEGVFNAKLSFFDSSIESISMNELVIDSDKTLIEVDESVPLNLAVPQEKLKWKKIIGIKPNAEFSSGELNLIVPKDSDFLFKCIEWNFPEQNCEGNWIKLLDLQNQQTVVIPFSPLDPGFAFASEQQTVSFDRLVECLKCGQHKVSPKTNILMTVFAETSEQKQDAVLEEFFPAEWQIVDPNSGIVSDVNSEFKKIEWFIGDFSGEISRTYEIFSPERTTPPTDYYFFSSISEESSGYWKIKVADPATDVNMTVEACAGGTTINSCAGLNAIDPTRDVDNTKNATFTVSMSDEAYTDSINSVTFFTNHSGASGIDGAVAYTLTSVDGLTTYCAEDSSIANSTSYLHESNQACTATGGWTAAKLDDLNISIKNTDGSGPTIAYYDYFTLTVNYDPNGTLSFDFDTPPADNNVSVNENEDFLVDGTTYCNTDDCGTVETTLQYCVGTGCSTWYDMNTVNDSPLYVVTGNQPQSASLNAGQNDPVSWAVNGNIADTYELRFSATGTTATSNTTDGTSRTITIQAGATDYTFTVLLPSSGCVEGEGSYDADAGCERGYFETTDLAGAADQNEVDAQGQVSDGGASDIAFIIYDNQSTASNDMNFDIDLNAALPAELKLKVSHIYNGWEGTCSGNAQVGCVNVTDTPANIGTAVYSLGTQDLNLFIWGDFVGAGVGQEDRNFYSVSKAST